MAVTRIKNNQITDLTVNAAAKLQDFSVTSAKLANNFTYGSDFTIAGNLTVQGNVTAIDTEDLVVEDPLILLAKDQTGTPSLDIGFIGKRGTEDNIAWVWDESADEFAAVFTDSEITNTSVNILSYASIHALDITAANLDISGDITFSGNITGNIVITGNVDATNFNATNSVTAASASITGNLDSGNLNATNNVTGTTVTASGNIQGNNAVITNDVSTATVTASGNVSGDNLVSNNDVTTSTVTASGNVSGETFLGNIEGTYATFTGNVDGANINATDNVTGVTITASGNLAGNNAVITNDVSTTTVTASGNVDGNNINATNSVTAVTVTASGNLEGNNAVITNDVSAVTGTFSGNVLAGNLNSNAAVTGVTVTASGNLNGNNAVITNDVSAASGSFSGNVLAGNLNSNAAVTGVTVTASGNVTGGNIIANSAVIGTTGEFTGNVTGDTWLGNIEGTYGDFTGNVTADIFLGNVEGVYGNFTGNIDANNLNAASSVTATDVIVTGNVDAGTAVNANLIVGTNLAIVSIGDLDLQPTGNIDVSGVRITNMSDPELAFDAATKQYVDDAVSSGITIHQPVRLLDRTLTQIGTYAQGGNTFTVTDTVASNTVVFSTAANLQVNDQLWFSNSFNGVVGNLAYFVVSTPNTSAAVLSTAYNGVPVSNITSGSGLTQSVRVNSGQGATLTATSNGALIVDSVNPIVGDRILLETQAADIENGVYVVTDAGNVSAPWILTRSSDMNTYIPDNINGVDSGDYFYVEEGANFAGQSHVMTSPVGPVIIGFDGLVFTLFSASQVYSANVNAGLVLLNGTQFNAKVDNDTTEFDLGGNISVKAGANLVTPNIGNATGNSLTLSGNGLLTATTVNVSGNVLAGNLNSNAAVTGVTVTASGNLSGNNAVITNDVSAATGTFTGNVDAGNINATDNVTGTTITASGNIEGNNAVITNDVSADTFSGNSLTVTGNVDAGNLNSNAAVTGVTITASGNLEGNNAVITNDVSAMTGTFTGNVDAGNLNSNAAVTGVTITASGNIEGNNAVITNDVSADTFSGNSLTVTGNVLAGNLNSNAAVTGVTITASGNLVGNNAVITGDVSAATITISGNISGNNVIAANSVTAIAIEASGNLAGNNAVIEETVFATAGEFTGNVTAANFIGNISGNIDAGGANTQIQFNDDDILNGNANFTFDKSTGQVTISGSLVVDNVVIDGDSITSLGSELVINSSGSDVNFRVAGDSVANLFIVDAGSDTVLIGTGSPTTGAALKIGTADSILIPTGNTLQRPGTPVTGMIRFNTTVNSLEFYDNDSWETAGTTFTIVTADTFNGDGSTVQFTLSEDSTTAATIVAINGVVQQPTTAYSVSGNVLTFTEAPESTDVIDARLLVTTTTVIGIQNASGNAVFEASATESSFVSQGNILPSANVTYDLGSSSLRWKDLYLAGNSLILGNIVMKNTGGNTVGFFGPDGTTPATLDANVQVVGDAIESGTSNVSFAGANGNIQLVSGGAITGIVTSTGANIAGYVTATGNVTGGNVITAGLVSLSSIVKTGSNGVGNIGSASSTFDTVFAKATSAQYADLAEMYEADQHIEPGTVVCFGGAQEVTVCDQDACVRVAGVISTDPSFIMNSGCAGEHTVAVALTGRTPTRVTGTVRKGDMMVSAGSGRARAEAEPKVGTVIGKALQDFDGAEGVIEVVIGRL